MRPQRHTTHVLMFAISLGIMTGVSVFAEETTLTTYYPAPFGVYDTLVAEKLVDYNGGTYNVPPVIGTDWFLDPSAPDTSVSGALKGKVGIGTGNPSNMLHVYSGTRPNNNILVSGVAPGLKFFGPGVTGPDMATIGLATAADHFVPGSAANDFVLRTTGTTGKMLFATGATTTERMRVTDIGRVGIGTTAPGGRLVVRGAGTGAGIGFQTENSNGNPLVTMLDNGNVGIGNATPPAALAIDAANDAGRNSTASWGGHSKNAQLRLGSNEDVAAEDYWVAAQGRWVSEMGDASNSNGYGDGDWGIKGSNMWSLPGGNVGIGTSSPSYKLDVSGTARVSSDAWFSHDVHMTSSILTINGPAASNILNVGGKAIVNGDFSAGSTIVNGTLKVGASISAGGINHTSSSCYNVAAGNLCSQGDVVFGIIVSGGVYNARCCRPGN